MGYSVTACAFVGVTLTPSAEQFKQIEVFCQAHPDLKHETLKYDEEEEPSSCVVYVQAMEIEEWGHSAHIDEVREQPLNVTFAQRTQVEELLNVLGEKPQEFKLVLSLRGN
jgi:hypothetical protein